MQKYKIKNSSPANIGVKRRSSLCRALADPQRWLILEWLLSREPSSGCTVGELVGQLNIADATVSHHLQILEQARLITRRRQGRYIICKVQGATLHELGQFMQNISGQVVSSEPCQAPPQWENNSFIWD